MRLKLNPPQTESNAMTNCFFVSDLHGKFSRYKALFKAIKQEKPEIVFFGGDLLPGGSFADAAKGEDFFADFFVHKLEKLKKYFGDQYPEIYLILGNDDARVYEPQFSGIKNGQFWHYAHNTVFKGNDFSVYGYAHVPPTPFRLKDWERYDVSRYVDPGCIHPTEGIRTVEVNEDIEYVTIEKDLNKLVGEQDLSRSIFLFHSPPYNTYLDRAALDGQMIDHVPLDVHVGSIAIERFIKERQPLLTLHGHIHESARLTGHWKQQIGSTWAITAAHDGPELALIRFPLEAPGNAERELVR